jgi:RNA polymerase sigma factor (TIGR02999 family)
MDAPSTHLELPRRPDASEHESLDQLIAFTYQELRTIAHARLRAVDGHGTLSTTALVHEVYLKLIHQSSGAWRDRSHFFAVASLAMRHVLVDCAKARNTLKRGGVRHQIDLDDEEIGIDDQADALLELDDALNRLAEVEPRLAKVVECRFFGGLTEEEVAAALDITVRTVRRDWVKARVMLRLALAS